MNNRPPFPQQYPARNAPQAPPEPRKRTMTLDKIIRGKVAQAPRVLVYGIAGIGKSTWASEAPDPIFLPTEDGTSELDVNRWPRPSTLVEFYDAIEELTFTDHGHKTLVIDTIDGLEPMVWSHICRRDGKADIEAYGFSKGQKTIAPAEWRVLLSKLERMCHLKKMGVILLGHEIVKSFKNPEGDDFDRYNLAIEPTAGGVLKGWCDAVLFCQYETFTNKEDKRARARGVSSGARIMHTEHSAAYDAKNRYELPPRMPLNYQFFADAVAAKSIATPQRLREKINALLTHVTDEELTNRVVAAVQKAGDDAPLLAKQLDRLAGIVGIQQSDNNQGAEDGQE